MCLIDTYSHVRGKVPYKSTYTSKKSILKMCNGRQAARVSFRNKLELASQSFSSVGIFCQCIMVTPRTTELGTCGGLTFICVTSGFGLPWALGK